MLESGDRGFGFCSREDGDLEEGVVVSFAGIEGCSRLRFRFLVRFDGGVLGVGLSLLRFDGGVLLGLEEEDGVEGLSGTW